MQATYYLYPQVYFRNYLNNGLNGKNHNSDDYPNQHGDDISGHDDNKHQNKEQRRRLRATSQQLAGTGGMLMKRVVIAGMSIVFSLLFTATYLCKYTIVLPLFLPVRLNNTDPNLFEGGSMDCQSLDFLSSTFDEPYDDDRYLRLKTAGAVDETEADIVSSVVCNKCYYVPDKPSFLMSRNTTCSSGDDVKLLLLIKTSPYRFQQRDAIRQFWINDPIIASQSHLVRYLFFMGHSEASYHDRRPGSCTELLDYCDKEQCDDRMTKWRVFNIFEFLLHADQLGKYPGNKLTETYKKFIVELVTNDDMLLIDEFIDSDDKSLEKTLAALRWSTLHCSKARFVAVIDDETVVFLDRMLNLLQPFESTPRFLAGNRMFVDRNRYQKWFNQSSVYKHAKTPEFFSSSIYVMGNDTVPALLHEVKYLNVAESIGLHLDDLTLTGFARTLRNISARHLCNFSVGTRLPWRVRNFYDIPTWTVAMRSTPRNSYLLKRALEKGKLDSFYFQNN